MNGLTRLNKEECVQKRKEAYRKFRKKNSEIIKIKVEGKQQTLLRKKQKLL